MRQLCVHRDIALKKLEFLSATPRATLTHLSCSSNFPRASYLDERTLTYEPIVNWRKIFRKNFTVPEPKDKTNANLNVCIHFHRQHHILYNKLCRLG